MERGALRCVGDACGTLANGRPERQLVPTKQSVSVLSQLGTGLLAAVKGKLDATIVDTKRKVAADPVRFGAFVALAANAALGKVSGGKQMPGIATKIVGALVAATVTEMVRANVKARANW